MGLPLAEERELRFDPVKLRESGEMRFDFMVSLHGTPHEPVGRESAWVSRLTRGDWGGICG